MDILTATMIILWYFGGIVLGMGIIRIVNNKKIISKFPASIYLSLSLLGIILIIIHVLIYYIIHINKYIELIDSFKIVTIKFIKDIKNITLSKVYEYIRV